MRYASALLIVPICIAVTGGTPAAMASRTTLSRCPLLRMSVAVTSSVQKLTRRARAGLTSVTARMFSARKCVTEDSRISMCIPLRIFSTTSSWS